MRDLDDVYYGDIEAYHDVGSMLEFYARLGLTSRFGPQDISHVNQLFMAVSDQRRLRDMLTVELRRRGQPIQGRLADNQAHMDWFDLAPLPSQYMEPGILRIVPRDEVVLDASRSKALARLRMERKHAGGDGKL